METAYDVIIVGFGKAGKSLAYDLGMAGKRVAVVERSGRMYGGACINNACIPSKYLVTRAREAAIRGASADAQYDKEYMDATRGRDTLVAKLRKANYDKLDRADNVDVLTGTASFVDAHTLRVAMPDQNPAECLMHAESIVLDTGTSPFLPRIKGIEGNRVYTNTTIENLRERPRSLAIVGGGFVGLEYAGIFSGFGTSVYVLHQQGTIMPREDEEDRDAVQAFLEKRGVRFLLGADTQHMMDTGTKTQILYQHSNEMKTLEVDAVLIATGRTPNTKELALKNAGIAADSRGYIQVDDHLRTNQPHIWAVGDVNGGPQFTYISYDDYRIVQRQLLGDGSYHRGLRGPFPTSLYLEYVYAKVGLNRKEALAAGRDCINLPVSLGDMPRFKQQNRKEGYLKLTVDKKAHTLLGATVFCEQGEDLIHFFHLALEQNATYHALKDRIYAHPSLMEALTLLP